MRHLIFPLFWAICIGFLCALGSANLPNMSFWEFLSFDKLVHVVMFCVLVLSLIVGLKRQNQYPKLRRGAFKYAILFGVFYGIVLELFQLGMNVGRAAELVDLIANSLGCVLGAIFFRFIYGKQLCEASY